MRELERCLHDRFYEFRGAKVIKTKLADDKNQEWV